MALVRRFYLSRELRFDVYDDGTVTMILKVIGGEEREIATKKLTNTSDASILRAFNDELAPYGAVGIYIHPTSTRLSEEMGSLREDVDNLKGRVKRLESKK